jgi:hypothetical protein
MGGYLLVAGVTSDHPPLLVNVNLRVLQADDREPAGDSLAAVELRVFGKYTLVLEEGVEPSCPVKGAGF